MSTVVQDKDESYQPPQESESDSESQDDLLEDLPSLSLNNQPSHNRARRTSVSAESMAPTTSNQPFEKIVIFKSHEQTKRIEASIMNNFLFKSLDEEQYTDVIGGNILYYIKFHQLNSLL